MQFLDDDRANGEAGSSTEETVHQHMTPPQRRKLPLVSN